MPKLCKCGCGKPVSETITKNGKLRKNQYHSVECRQSHIKRSVAEKRICACGCGKEFISKRKNVIFASARCRCRAYEKELMVIKPDEIPPKCACGCGLDVGKNARGEWNKYIANHYKEASPESIEKMRQARIGRHHSEETKKKSSETHKQKWSDQEYRERMLESLHSVPRKPKQKKDIGSAPLCLCNCGLPTERRGNHWNKYLKGHYENMEHRRKMELLGEAPFCKCGCGMRTELNNKKARWNEYYGKHYQKDPAYIDNMRNVMNTPEKKSELSNKSKELWDGGKYTEGIRARCSDPEWQRQASERSKTLWQDSEYMDKVTQKNKELWSDPIKRQEASERSKALMQDPKHKEKLYKAIARKPNGFESLFEQLKPDMFIKYVGDFKLWVTLPNGKSKNPDFIIEGTNKVIELHGNYWHKNENSDELVEAYKAVGYDCLVIWENEMTDIKAVMKRVSDFLKK